MSTLDKRFIVLGQMLYDLNMFEEEQFGNRGIDIKHFDGYDLVINHTQREVDPDELESLIKTVSTLVGEKKIIENSFDDWPQVSWDGLGKHYIDNKESPKFFVKRKWIVPSMVGMTEDGPKTFTEILRSERTEKTSKEITVLQTTNSVMAEMRLAPRIKELLTSDEVLEMFASMGIEKVRNIDPLVAIIDRETKRKYVIYPHKKGTAIDSKMMDVDKQNGLVKNIKAFFEENGVLVDDLEYANQIMVDVDAKTVYFNDTEAWSMIPENMKKSQLEERKLINPTNNQVAIQVIQIDDKTLEIQWVNSNLMPTRFSTEGPEGQMYKYIQQRFPDLKKSIGAGFSIDTDEDGVPLAIGETGVSASMVRRVEKKHD